MSISWRARGGAVTLGAALCACSQAAAISCHLHAPDDYAPFSKQPLVIPAVGNEMECEQLNRERFGARGRRHCTPGRIGNNRIGLPDFRETQERPSPFP